MQPSLARKSEVRWHTAIEKERARAFIEWNLKSRECLTKILYRNLDNSCYLQSTVCSGLLHRLEGFSKVF